MSGVFGESDRRQRGSGLRPQLLIAVVIAIFAVIQYFSSGQKNPITGEFQRVDISPQQEVQLGLQSAPEMARQMGGVVRRTDPRAQLVRTIGEKLVANSEAAKGPYEFDFHLLADSKTVNAFALPGGQVFITLALLQRLETEAQVAGVLGHEIGHVVHRHSAQHMATGKLFGQLSTAVGVAASGDNDPRTATAAAQMVSQMMQLKYGRDDENESDSYALKILPLSGYDPSAMMAVMKVLMEVSKGAKQPEFLSSHPYPEQRLARIQQILEEEYPRGIPPQLSQGRELSVQQF